jgi:hypothetical protein
MLPPARRNSLIGCGQLAFGSSCYRCEPAGEDSGSRLGGTGAGVSGRRGFPELAAVTAADAHRWISDRSTGDWQARESAFAVMLIAVLALEGSGRGSGWTAPKARWQSREVGTRLR